MRRMGWLLLIGGWMMVMGSSAWADIRLCLDPNEHADTLLLNIVDSGESPLLWKLNGRWRGAEAYQLLGAGTFTRNSEADTSASHPWVAGLTLANGSAFFSGNPNCALTIYFGAAAQGLWKMTCVGLEPAFVVQGTLTVLDTCQATAMAPQAERPYRPLAGE